MDTRSTDLLCRSGSPCDVLTGHSLGWKRWVAVTLTAFYAICRPGEPLRSLRRYLVTSEDLLEDGEGIFLVIPEPKTKRRGASVQHSQVRGPGFVLRFIRTTFQPLSADAPLYDGSASMYRRRWDALLTALLVEPRHRLTPGSLRGGGAVRAYRSGEWRMRLRHQATLGFYLQEVAALSVLPALSEPSRTRIRSSAALMPFVLFQQMTARWKLAVSTSGGGLCLEETNQKARVAFNRPGWPATCPTKARCAKRLGFWLSS